MTWDILGGGAQREFWVIQNSRGKNWGAGHTTAQHKPLGPPPVFLWVLTALGVCLTSCHPAALPLCASSPPLCPPSEPWAGPQGHCPILCGETSTQGLSEDPDRVSRLWAGGVMNRIWGDVISRGPPWGGASVHPKRKLREGGGSCL